MKPQMREAFKNHALLDLPAGDTIRAFRMHDPNQGRIMSVLLLFTPEGIVICGDMSWNAGKGLLSDFGYGLDWFLGATSERYLCEKFLKKVWQREVAAEECLEAAEGSEHGAAWRKLAEDLRGAGDFSQAEFYEAIAVLGEPDDIGYDYDASDAGWLCELRARFAELYEARFSPPAAAPAPEAAK